MSRRAKAGVRPTPALPSDLPKLGQVRYRWQVGFHGPVSAEVFGAEYHRLRSHYGIVTAQMLVEAAEDPESPLHPAFEWDPDVASRKYRETEARHMLGHFVIIRLEQPKSRPIRAFVAVSRGEGQKDYVPIQVALASRRITKQVLTEALARLKAWRYRYAELTELARLFGAIDRELHRH